MHTSTGHVAFTRRTRISGETSTNVEKEGKNVGLPWPGTECPCIIIIRKHVWDSGFRNGIWNIEINNLDRIVFLPAFLFFPVMSTRLGRCILEVRRKKHASDRIVWLFFATIKYYNITRLFYERGACTWLRLTHVVFYRYINT